MTETLLTQDKFEARVDQLAEGIKDLKKKSEKARDDVKETLEGQIEKLQFKTEQLRNNVKIAGQAGKQSWGEVKEGAERAWQEIKKGYDQVQAQLN